MSSQCDFVIADGAIRSGKTIACIIGFLTWSQEMFAGQSFILAGKTMGALKKNVIRPMLQILEAWGWPYNYVRSGTDARIEIGTNTYYLYGANTEAAQDGSKLTTIASSTAKAIGVGMLAAGTAIVGVGTAAVKSANDIDQAMNQYIASTG